VISLENFDKHNTKPPYLNSPRSLEACKRHGIEPAELLHIPLSKYKETLEEKNLSNKIVKSLWEHNKKKREEDFQLVCEVNTFKV